MASFKRNIHHNIQVGLDARVDAMNLYHHSKQKLRSGLLGSAKTNDDYTLSREAQLAKSTYVRMISPGTLATHVIYGGFNIDDIKIEGQSSGENDYFKSQSDRITGPETAYYETATDHASLKGLRPKAGITNVNVLFQGYGGAVRKATVTWACSSLEQLSMYQKGSFLSPGQTIILDWGWVRSESGQKGGIKEIPKFLIKDGDNVKLNNDLFNIQTEKVGDDEFTKYTPVWDQLEIAQYGDWSGIIGPVTKFTWSQRDDGGFDCITEMLSRGSNIFEKQIPQVASDKGAALSTFPIQRLTHDQFVNAVVKKAIEEDGQLNEKVDTLAQFGESMLSPHRPLFNIAERIDTLDYEILAKYFPDNIKKASELKSAKLSVDGDYDIVVSDDNNIFGILRKKGADGEGSPDLYEEEDEDDDGKKLYSRARDFSSEIWVRWGWFEDNVVSYYSRENVNIDGNIQRISEFRSLIPKANIDPEKKLTTSVLIKDHLQLKTYDPSVFVIAEKYNEKWFHNPPDEFLKKVDRSYYELAIAFGEYGQKFSVGDSGTSGQGKLRNLYINLSVIKRSFTSPGASIQSGMLAMAKSLNAGINIWDFEVGQHQTPITDAQRTFYIKERGKDEGDSTEGLCEICNKEESQLPAKSYIFDNYGESSIIHDISLTATVPDKFAIVAGYGAESGKTNPDEDAMKKYFTDTADASGEKIASAVGEFYSNSENLNVFKPNLPTNPDPHFGNPNELDDGVPNLSNSGLNNSSWSHKIVTALADTSTSTRISGREHFAKKYKAAMAKQRADAKKARDAGKDFEVEHLFPHTLDPTTHAGQEELAPYNLNDGKLKKDFVSSISWLLVDCPATRLKTQQSDIIMPINIDMTLEGVGGIYPGNMFRLSYLPESYGQVNFKDNEPSASPLTYFSIMGITQTINAEGWQTKVTAVTNKAVQESTGEKIDMLEAQKNVLKAYDAYMHEWVAGHSNLSDVPEVHEASTDDASLPGSAEFEE